MDDAYGLVAMLVNGGCQAPLKREGLVIVPEEKGPEGQVAKWIELSADSSGNLVVRFCPGDPDLNTFQYPGPVNHDEILEAALRAWTSRPHFGEV
jgi:hypothetical protein